MKLKYFIPLIFIPLVAYGTLVDFPGGATTDNIRIASDLGIGAGVFTAGCWFNVQSAPPSNTTFAIFSHTDAGTSVRWFFGYRDNAGTKQLVWDRTRLGTEGVEVAADVTLTNGAWHYVGYNYDGTNIEGYYDGVSQGTTATSGNGSASISDFYELGVSRQDNDTIINKADAQIAHCVVLNASSSATRIQNLQYKRPPDNDPNLVLYWPLDEGSGTTAKDHSGTFNGTLNGNTAYLFSSPPAAYR